jgi:hypothetical protein
LSSRVVRAVVVLAVVVALVDLELAQDSLSPQERITRLLLEAAALAQRLLLGLLPVAIPYLVPSLQPAAVAQAPVQRHILPAFRKAAREVLEVAVRLETAQQRQEQGALVIHRQ